jgi:hypothetical protein
VAEEDYLAVMNALLLMSYLLLLFCGIFYFGGPVIGGAGIGLILLTCLMVYSFGGWHVKS